MATLNEAVGAARSSSLTVLDRYDEGSASQAQQTDTIRLLLLTGRSGGEIV